MSTAHTEKMEDLAFEYDEFDNDDDYKKMLLKAIEAFRRFDEVIDDFILDRGYDGDIQDIDVKTAFIHDKFKKAGIKAPRGIREWFFEHKTVERKSAFQLAFAFGLTVDETAELFRRICLGRCFDCHTVTEAVYFYCMKNGLSYADAEEIIKSVPRDVKGKIPRGEVLYTKNIKKELERIKSCDELVDYLTRNNSGFDYNNAAATKYIQNIWSEIAGEGGLAYSDRQLKSNSSVWSIYLHILGFDNDNVDLGDKDNKDEDIKKSINRNGPDRSLKPILKDNKLLHPLAAASFPDREGINRALNGEHLSYERIRKLLILLLFYRFWEQKLTKNGRCYTVTFEDKERCIADINRYLIEVDYPVLYCGDPYDWIFVWVTQAEDPLDAFRYFIGELYVESQMKNSKDAVENPG